MPTAINMSEDIKYGSCGCPLPPQPTLPVTNVYNETEYSNEYE